MSSDFDSTSDFLALDFDGVIADSIEECLVVGHNAYGTHRKTDVRITTLADLPPRRVREAKRLRNFIRSGADYVFLFHALDRDVAIENQDDFDRFLNAHTSLQPVYFHLFYEERETFSSTHHEEWIRLNPLYPGISDFLKSFKAVERLLIITTKKIQYAFQILSAHTLPFVQTNGYHADARQPKDAIIDELLQKHRLPPSRFHFVDDQIDTLLQAAPLGIRSYLADWGYVNDEQRLRAEQDGIEILPLPEFLRRFSMSDLS